MALLKASLRQDEEIDESFAAEYDGQLALAQAFLSKHGVEPDPATGRYQEEDLIEAIRARGWVPEVRRIEGWEVTVSDPSGERVEGWAVGAGKDRTDALLAALRELVTYLTAEESRMYFDETAQDLLGMNGDEFRRRWSTGEIDRNDPTVVHVSMLLPNGG